MERLEKRDLLASDILLSSAVVPEDAAGGFVVGSLSATDPEQLPTGLALLYDHTSGEVRIKNFGQEVGLDAYQLYSTAGKLDAIGWETVDEWLAEDGEEAVALILGPGENATNWDAVSKNSSYIAELNLLGSAVLSKDESWRIGSPFQFFDPSDLVFEYRDASAHSVKAAQVLYDLDGPEFTTSDLRFEVVGSELRVKSGAKFDYETETSVAVSVTVMEMSGAKLTKDLVVQIQNVIEPTQPGDADGDGDVDLADFGILKDTFGSTVTPGQQADFDGDGKVDLRDFGILKDNFGA